MPDEIKNVTVNRDRIERIKQLMTDDSERAKYDERVSDPKKDSTSRRYMKALGKCK